MTIFQIKSIFLINNSIDFNKIKRKNHKDDLRKIMNNLKK
jgi:hypothetical protein